MAARHATRVTAEAAKKPWCRVFYAQALDAIAVGVTALIHLEIVSTFALGLGRVAGNLACPGAGSGGATVNAEADQYLLN